MRKNLLNVLQIQNLLFLVLLLVFAFYLLITLNKQGFWHDEIYTLSFIKGFDIYLFEGSDLKPVDQKTVSWYVGMLKEDNYWQNLYRNLVHEGHPPLYYLALKFWSYLFGANEMGLRSFSLFTSCLSLCVAFRISKLSGSKFAILFPLLLATAPLFIYYSSEARSYSLYILLSLLCFYYFLNLKSSLGLAAAKSKSSFIGLLVSATLLFYTHYYGVFLYGVFALILSFFFLKRNDYKSIILLGIPGVLFTPWITFIQKQTQAHSTHWTDGYLGLKESLLKFIEGAATLLTSPFNDGPSLALWIAFGAILVIVVNYFISKSFASQKVGFILLMVLLYGIFIIVFDKLLDHHTIAVPRYYIPLQFILLFYISRMILNGKSKWISSAMTICLIFAVILLQVDFHKGIREPKQMYREAAGYISQNYNSNEVELVVSPNGPSAVALAYYLSEDFIINSLPASSICSQYSLKDIIIVEQRLGLADEPWMQPCKTDMLNDRTVRFVGLDVINEK